MPKHDDYNDYTFSLSNVLKSNKALEVLKEYLKQTHNQELVEFLESVNQFKLHIKQLYEQFMGETVDLEAKGDDKDEEKLGKTFHSSMPFEIFVHIHKEFEKRAKNLIDTYLTPAGPKEINFSGAVKSQMLANYRELCNEYTQASEKGEEAKHVLNDINLKHRHYNLFAGLESVVMHMLRSDVFPRFTRSEMWFKFLKKNKKLLGDIAIRDGEEFAKMLYTEEDYFNPVISDQDFDSLRYFLQDSPKWKLKALNNATGPLADRSYYYAMKDNFIIGDNLPKTLKNRRLGKLVIYLPCDAIDAAHFLFGAQYQTAIDKTCKKLVHVGYFNADKTANRKYALSLIELHYKFFPKPCDKRLYRFTWSLTIDPLDTTRLLFVGRTNQPELEAPNGFVDSSCYFGWCIKQVEKNLTCFTQVFSVNLGGKIQNMPQWMNNNMMEHVYKERAKNMSQLMKKLLFERAAHGWPEVTESYGRLDTLLENCKNLHNTYKMPEDNDISGLSLWDFAKKELKTPSHKIREGTTL